ncbi:DUF5998 family protein [Micrococcoides hystricis]|uniref:DUF5998 family protein n=1 Tax=Micrococcoides hystricis TaxID=1572761 RepID=A0ABV6P6V7_9MICC
MTDSTQPRTRLMDAVERAGFYPDLVNQTLQQALGDVEPLEFLVNVDMHFDMEQMHRHITVLMVTDAWFVVAHLDGSADEDSDEASARIATEVVPLKRVRSVVLSTSHAKPEHGFHPDHVQEVELAVAWGQNMRIDVGPASCGDPNCDIEHGLTGNQFPEDLLIRVAEKASGAMAVQKALSFGQTLRTAWLKANA